MAGYMTKVVGADAIYEGSYLAGEDLLNGQFLELKAGKMMKTTAAKDMVLVVKEKDTLWGRSALRCDVLDQGSGGVYFNEKLFTDYGDEFDDTKTVTKKDKHVRAHMPLTGEEMLFEVADELYAALNVGDQVTPAAGGTVAKKAEASNEEE